MNDANGGRPRVSLVGTPGKQKTPLVLDQHMAGPARPVIGVQEDALLTRVLKTRIG